MCASMMSWRAHLSGVASQGEKRDKAKSGKGEAAIELGEVGTGCFVQETTVESLSPFLFFAAAISLRYGWSTK